MELGGCRLDERGAVTTDTDDGPVSGKRVLGGGGGDGETSGAAGEFGRRRIQSDSYGADGCCPRATGPLGSDR